MTDSTAVKQIAIDGVKLTVMGDGIQFSDLARFQQKVLFGDPTKDDNDLLSSWQMDDWSGGSGVYDMKEGTDAQRFYMSTMNLRFPGQATKPPYVGDNTAGSVTGSGNKRVLGELWSESENDFMVIYTAGMNVRRAIIDGTVPGGQIKATGYDLSGPTLTLGLPVNPGVAYQGEFIEERFFIPLGNAGYAVVADEGTYIEEFDEYEFVAFTVWDHKLIGITTGGRLYRTIDGDTWTAYDLTYALSKNYRIRGLVNFFDRGDRPCIYVLTDRDIWQFDPDGPELFRIDFGWPSHKYHANTACVWQGQLFIAIGMGVFRYTGGAWMPVGLDRDHGIPGEYQGHIVELVADWNGMYALVQGTNVDSVYGSKSSLHCFTGAGWQCLWTQDTAVPDSIQYHGQLAQTALTVTGLVVTQSGGVSTLMFSTAGSDDKVYSMPLSMTFANPRAGIGAGQLFGNGAYYYLETPEFNAEMFGYVKIANAFQFYLEEPIAITDPNDRDTFRILYRLDRGEWKQLASVEAEPGRYAVPFGEEMFDSGLTDGESWETIQFRFEILRGETFAADKPMVLNNSVFSFLKTVSSNDSLTFNVDVSQGTGDMSPDDAAAWLDSLPSSKKFHLMSVGKNTVYRVFISQNAGKRPLGDSQIHQRQLSVVQIPTGL